MISSKMWQEKKIKILPDQKTVRSTYININTHEKCIGSFIAFRMSAWLSFVRMLLRSCFHLHIISAFDNSNALFQDPSNILGPPIWN